MNERPRNARARTVAAATVLALLVSGITLTPLRSAAGQLTRRYTDPGYFTGIPFGTNSHWNQPWRAYMETLSTATFVDGTGVNFNVDANQADNVAAMLAKYGIHHARIDMDWGSFSYEDEDRFDDSSLALKLAVLKRHGLRPLIVLNGNSRHPCPLLTTRRKAARDAAAGDRTVVLDNASGLIPNYSGISNLGKGYDAASILIVGLDGNVATLSKPLPVGVSAGTSLEIATLKYRPFSSPGTAEFETTLKGWERYVVNVGRIARADLGTTGQADAGFDLEIWNELTFGSAFLSIDNYYSPATGANPTKLIWGPIVDATAATVESRPDLFSGALLGDGFANTIPWRASSAEPARVDAIDKHPYQSHVTFPANEQKGTHVNAAFEADQYVPAYSANFPEYWATGIRGDNLIHDMAPYTSMINGKAHGRNARVVNGKVLPVTVWITEVNNDPERDNPAVTDAAALQIKGKATARYFSFFLNKGVTQLDLYAVQDRNDRYEDRAMNVVRNDFLQYADRPGAPYPTDDRPYVSPALLVTGRIADKMKVGLDRHLAAFRQLHINALAAENDPVIFAGDGTAAHPDLHAVDVFAFLPFQANAHRFVIPYYVMTRDVTVNFPEDQFGLDVTGFPAGAHYSVYDPFTDQTYSIAPASSSTGVRLQLPTTDYPRLLIVDDAGQ